MRSPGRKSCVCFIAEGPRKQRLIDCSASSEEVGYNQGKEDVECSHCCRSRSRKKNLNASCSLCRLEKRRHDASSGLSAKLCKRWRIRTVPHRTGFWRPFRKSSNILLRSGRSLGAHSGTDCSSTWTNAERDRGPASSIEVDSNTIDHSGPAITGGSPRGLEPRDPAPDLDKPPSRDEVGIDRPGPILYRPRSRHCRRK